jgi:hypothetical protein
MMAQLRQMPTLEIANWMNVTNKTKISAAILAMILLI